MKKRIWYNLNVHIEIMVEKESGFMTYEEQKEKLKPIIQELNFIPNGEFIPSAWEAPEGYHFERFNVGNVPVEHLIPEKKNGKVIYQLHGGGYVVALSDLYRDTAIRYSQLAGGAEVYSIDYRVAPTNVFPAALDDAVLVYKWLLEQGHKSEDILFVGDSAGGNLVLTTTLYARDNSMPLPKGIIAISPWAYIETNKVSVEENEDLDLILGSSGIVIRQEVKFSRYFEGKDLKNPYVSPAYADFTGFPSMLIQTGSYEVLRDDSFMVAKACKEAGVDVTQTTYEGQSHVFQIIFPEDEIAMKAWAEMKEFVERIFK